VKEPAQSDQAPAMTEIDPRIEHRLRQFVLSCCTLSIAFGCLVLVGWEFDRQIVKTILPGQVAVVPNTAVCFLLFGAGLWVLRKRQSPAASFAAIAAKLAAAFLGVVGLLSIVEFAFRWDFGIDQLLFRAGPEDVVGSARAGLMSPITGFGFLGSGITLLILDARSRVACWSAQWLPCGVVIAATFGILDFVLNAHTVHTYISPATASLLFIDALALLFSRPDRGMGALMASTGSGGTLTRRLLPAAILAPLVIAWLRWRTEAAGLVSEWSGLALMSVSSIVFLAAVIVWTGLTFNRNDLEKRCAQQTLARLASIVTSSSDAIFAKTLDGIITDWNPGAETIYGYSAEEMLGHSIAISVPEDRSQEFAELMDRVKRGQRIQHHETVRLRRNGQRFHVLLSIDPILDSKGNIVGACNIARDITERKRAEEEVRTLNRDLEARVQQRTAQLQESEQRVRRKLESILSPEGEFGSLDLSDVLDVDVAQALIEKLHALAPIPIAVIDVNANILAGICWQDACTKFHRVNPESCKNCLESDRLLSAGAVAGEFKIYRCKNNLWDVVTPIMVGERHLGNFFVGQFFFEDEPVDLDLFRAQAKRYGFDEASYLAAIDAVPRVSRDFINANMAFLAKLAQVLSQLGYSSVKLARSHSELNRINADLTSSLKELEAFTYSVSHDLRAPLRHISGFSNILSEEFGSTLTPEAQHHLQRIQEGTRRMGLLVDDLLNLARIGRRDLALRVENLTPLVDEAVAELASECAGREIKWTIGKLDSAKCDPGLVKQVFLNLLSNSIKFTRPRRSAVIEIGEQDIEGTPTLFVRDNGVGFNMKYVNKLFGVFQRLHRAEEFEGTGVGLATVQRIVQKHGGRIWCEAELDKGATFYFTLAAPEKKDSNAKAARVGEAI